MGIRLNRSVLKKTIKAAKAVSELTHKSFCFHYFDALCCFLKYGCEAEQYSSGEFYRLRSFNRKYTYTTGRSYKAKQLFNTTQSLGVLMDKVKFNTFFSRYVKRKWISCENADEEAIISFIQTYPKVIVKPADGMKGYGIHLLNDEIRKELGSLSGQKLLLEEFIEQHPLMAFNNKSVNTIRIITLKDAEGIVHCLKAALRCGVGNSIVDNMSAGGVAYPIRIEYGRVEGPGLSGTYSIENKNYYFIHPGTNTFMPGYEIPFWNEVLETVISAAKSLDSIRFVGWDVAVTPTGPELIEGNSRPGPATLEYFGLERGFYGKIMSRL